MSWGSFWLGVLAGWAFPLLCLLWVIHLQCTAACDQKEPDSEGESGDGP